MKLCKDCKFSEIEWNIFSEKGYTQAMCGKFRSKASVVTGISAARYSAIEARHKTVLCGPEALEFRARLFPNIKLFIKKILIKISQ